ncbi:SCP2 sterol-binding domain-containing protein [Pseudomonas sp. F1_0610]|uniref:ubiquinone anaerobic biosynthesis accessory factor UbiT n=1 Tax=Pseudomonas sp. F1_0610 TaxID=3114284 RepID=UPI0039C0CDBB
MHNQLTQLLLKTGDKLLPITAFIPFPIQRFTLEKSLNHFFQSAIEDGLFDLLAQRWLKLSIRDLNLSWCITLTAHQQLIITQNTCHEVEIKGNWRDFLALASRQEDPDTLFFRRRLQITGDTELGLGVKNLIDSLDPDILPSWLWHSLQYLGKQLKAQQAA